MCPEAKDYSSMRCPMIFNCQLSSTTTATLSDSSVHACSNAETMIVPLLYTDECYHGKI